MKQAINKMANWSFNYWIKGSRIMERSVHLMHGKRNNVIYCSAGPLKDE